MAGGKSWSGLRTNTSQPPMSGHDRLAWLLAAVLVAGAVVLLATPYYAYALLAPLGVAGLLVLGRWPALGFSAILFLVPFQEYRGFSDALESFTLSKVLGILVAVLVLLRWVQSKQMPGALRSPLWPWVAGLFLAAVLALVFSPFPETAADGVRKLFTAVVFLALSLALVDEKAYRVVVPAVLITAISVGSVLAVYGYLTGSPMFAHPEAGITRATGGAGNPNHFCAMVIFTLPLITYWLSGAAGAQRLLAAVLLMLNVTAVIVTFSRAGALVLAFTGVLLIVAYARRVRPRQFGLVVSGAAMAVVVAGLSIPQSYWERQATVTDRTDPAIGRRASYLVVAREAVQQRPVLGWGADTFRDLYAKSGYAARYALDKEDYQRHAHNSYIEVLIGTGVVGVFFFGAVIVTSLRNFHLARQRFLAAGRQRLAELTAAYRISFASLLLYFLFLSDVHHKYFWLMAGVSQVALLLAQRATEPTGTATQGRPATG